ncbi:hypothetical protein BU26DRAFT_33509 [Trematosphaeria pertusa]|uniref:Sister chromatid cohesion protein Ctf8 n=1 Tax=Trematosphaeria pertusa TaxID=390896 RepID=A0A6A6J2D7_9PLEO|nr:uncharacterized protein BU26DRAFT_33509 [Trematosphaeria pertusa]KAF2256994.1 hypothetical protein BU26DRAFT_33509 [Trematosphaeria pertusa]
MHGPAKRVASAPPTPSHFQASNAPTPTILPELSIVTGLSLDSIRHQNCFAMPTIPLHPRPLNASSPTENPLPPLLHTPTGLALLELQGTIHFPPPTASPLPSTQVGKLVFPLYNPALNGPDDTKWMKRVYFYVGQNQRMTGEVKKLGKPFAVIRKRETYGEDVDVGGVEGGREGKRAKEEVEVVEIVRWKIVFSSRPEPVGGSEEGG